MGCGYDVAVIGGGVIGGSIAYQLAKRGKKVILLEKGRLASESSAAAAGMLGAQVEMGKETGPLFELAVKSRAMFPKVAEELREVSGIDIGFVNRGMLRIATSADERNELMEVIACQTRAGQQAEWLSGEDVRLREPGLSEHVIGAAYIPNDGQVLAPELAMAFLKSAAALGAELREFTEVKGLATQQGKVTGVITTDETIECGQVVVATGAWSGQFFNQIGSSLPVYPVKGECFSVLAHKPLLTATVYSHDCYMVPKRGGRLLVGATSKAHTFDRKPTMGGISQLMERAHRLLPGIADAEWEKAWAGVRPQTARQLPHLGEHPEWKGLILATGHYRNGILLSPVTGEIIADLIENRNVGKWDLGPFQVADCIEA